MHTRIAYENAAKLEATKRPTDFFSTDNSFVLGNYSGLIQRWSLMEWITHSSKLCNELEAKYFRVMPLPSRPFTLDDFKKIKFTLHVLLSLGNVIYLPITNRSDYLSSRFGVDNILTIQNGLSISADQFWREGLQHMEVSTDTSTMDAFSSYKDPQWRETSSVVYLRYGLNSFNTGVVRSENLNKRYAMLLYHLQNGKCAITNSTLLGDMQVDHIYPASKGGNNTLINLQAVNLSANREKSAEVDPLQQRHLSNRELIEMGLDCYHPYLELTSRTTTQNPFGYLLL